MKKKLKTFLAENKVARVNGQEAKIGSMIEHEEISVLLEFEKGKILTFFDQEAEIENGMVTDERGVSYEIYAIQSNLPDDPAWGFVLRNIGIVFAAVIVGCALVKLLTIAI